MPVGMGKWRGTGPPARGMRGTAPQRRPGSRPGPRARARWSCAGSSAAYSRSSRATSTRSPWRRPLPCLPVPEPAVVRRRLGRQTAPRLLRASVDPSQVDAAAPFVDLCHRDLKPVQVALAGSAHLPLPDLGQRTRFRQSQACERLGRCRLGGEGWDDPCRPLPVGLESWKAGKLETGYGDSSKEN